MTWLVRHEYFFPHGLHSVTDILILPLNVVAKVLFMLLWRLKMIVLSITKVFHYALLEISTAWDN
jgi:hypothetical protein